MTSVVPARSGRRSTCCAATSYYQARTISAQRPTDADRLANALRLSARASDRERLIIRTMWARLNGTPALRALAESLAIRFPEEVEGHQFLGVALIVSGDFLAAVPSLERVVAMDSLALLSSNSDCTACSALSDIVGAYEHADSLTAAERIARGWVARQPQSAAPHRALAVVLEHQGRELEAHAEFESAARLGRISNVDLGEDDVALRIRSLDFAVDDRLAERIRAGHPDAMFWLATSLRAQGRLDAALEVAYRFRAGAARSTLAPGSAPYDAISSAQVLFERGQFRAAAALFDSIARGRALSDEPSALARNKAWFLTHSADARAAAGDTARFVALADTIQALGAQSASGRDQRLHHHVRGLLLAARGRHADAVVEFRSAVYSYTAGFTRTNLELARSLLALGKPLDAVSVLRPALHGPLDAANYYVTHAELHEMLGRAWEAAAVPDSAAVHYAYVARAWAKSDSRFAPRLAVARAKSERRVAR